MGALATPEFEPRRFDTYFFVARLPERQRTRDVGGEAEHTIWARPEELSALPMLPPTMVTLRQLAAFDSLDAAMLAGASRDLSTPLMPRFGTDADGPHLLILDDSRRRGQRWRSALQATTAVARSRGTEAGHDDRVGSWVGGAGRGGQGLRW